MYTELYSVYLTYIFRMLFRLSDIDRKKYTINWTFMETMALADLGNESPYTN